MHIRQRVGKLVESFLPEVVRIRQVLHQHPEMALQEHYTSGLMRQALESTGIELLPPFMDTDVVGILTGKGQGRRVALRADMDALPLQEKTGLRYRSERDGFMHACGHDGHTAALLGTALVLSRLRDEFSGSVRFVFQPGEEIVAAGRELVIVRPRLPYWLQNVQVRGLRVGRGAVDLLFRRRDAETTVEVLNTTGGVKVLRRNRWPL